jgi:alpha-methylacyl-CoA racemase
MGPLAGFTILEFASIGPGPFCAMMLADMGADVIRVDRKGAENPLATSASTRFNVMNRGRRSIALDLKQPADVEVALKLSARADALIEGLRPGVMERLGLGPDVCLARNPKLVYGRMTGWGQTGPLAHVAGHDLNYIALSGVLHAIGRHDEPPVPPLNLVGDFGGGGLLLAFGIVCALLAARQSGQGQVVDAAMVDGAAVLAASFYGMHAAQRWSNERERNLLDGGAHYYCCYECADRKYVAIGSLEPQFYALLLEKCGLSQDPAFQNQRDTTRWKELGDQLAVIFKRKTRDEWCQLMEGSDVCFAPVLDWDEAPQHPHNQARGNFINIAGVTQPAPAPRFSRTQPTMPSPPVAPGAHTAEILQELGA